MTSEIDRLGAAADEHAKHLARYATVYDGKGGVKWQDDGGLACNCGWTAPRDKHGRPWPAWHRHVVAAVLACVTRPAVEGGDDR